MSTPSDFGLHEARYRAAFGAEFRPYFDRWMERPGRAALGYRNAAEGPLYLESYLDRPIEAVVGDALGRDLHRGAIVEIGNFAANNAIAMIQLWGRAANDLSGASEVAVATLTAPLRDIFRRIGVPIVELAPACSKRLGRRAVSWGSYYDHDPIVCAGEIAAGQAALSRYAQMTRRRRGE